MKFKGAPYSEVLKCEIFDESSLGQTIQKIRPSLVPEFLLDRCNDVDQRVNRILILFDKVDKACKKLLLSRRELKGYARLEVNLLDDNLLPWEELTRLYQSIQQIFDVEAGFGLEQIDLAPIQLRLDRLKVSLEVVNVMLGEDCKSLCLSLSEESEVLFGGNRVVLIGDYMELFLQKLNYLIDKGITDKWYLNMFLYAYFGLMVKFLNDENLNSLFELDFENPNDDFWRDLSVFLVYLKTVHTMACVLSDTVVDFKMTKIH